MRDPAKFKIEFGDKEATTLRGESQALLKDFNGAPKTPGEVHRGCILPGAAIAKLTQGATFRARGFLSSSSSEKQGQVFADAYNDTLAGWGRNEAKLTRAMLHLTQRSGVSLAGVSRLPQEEEIVVRPGTRFKVDRVAIKPNDHGDAVTHVYMTEQGSAAHKSDDEARDEDGKWTTGGGSSSPAAAKPEAEHAAGSEAYFRADKDRLKRAISYSKGGYDPINQYLRDPAAYEKSVASSWGEAKAKEVTGWVRADAQALLKDFNGAPKSPGEVHRGVLLPAAVLAKLKAGATYRARSFLSSSTSAKRGEKFSEHHNPEHMERAVLHLTQRTGVSIAGVSFAPDEKEVVVRPGTRFKIGRVSSRRNEDDEPVTHIYMTEQ